MVQAGFVAATVIDIYKVSVSGMNASEDRLAVKKRQACWQKISAADSRGSDGPEN
jgi:hypothetical protein